MRSRGIDRRSMLRMVGSVGAVAGLGAAAVAELLRLGRVTRLHRTEARLGTLVSIEILHEDRDEARRVLDLGFEKIRRLESVLSRHDPNSLLSHLNREGALSDPDEALLAVLGAAQALSRRTAGAFDVTVAPLLDLHERAHGAWGRAPTAEEVRLALDGVGYEGLGVSPDRVVFDKPRMSVTLDGIAKGYVVDQVVAEIRRAGVPEVLVDAGGDIATMGLAGGAGWPVAIQRPPGTAGPTAMLRLETEAVATSGDYMRTFTQDRRSHHIIDPRTGYSPSQVSSVSVRAPTAMEADALSTAAMILGLDAGPAFLDGVSDVEGMVVGKGGELRTTAGWAVRTGPRPRTESGR